MERAPQPARPQRRLAAPALLATLFAALTLPVIWSGRGGTSEAYDQARHHEPAIRAFARDWPRVDLVNFDSATTPGYHLALAAVARWGGGERVVLQMASWLLSLGLLAVVYVQAARVLHPGPAALLTAPFLASSYVLGSAIWLVTDNAALLFVVLAVGSCLSAARAAPLARGGLAAAAAVLVRQVHAWIAAPLALRAVLEARCAARSTGAAWARASWALLPLLVAAGFFVLWSGPTPPMHAARHAAGPNPAIVPATLALLGVFGPFHLPAFVRRWEDVLPRRWWMWAAAAGAAALALLLPSGFDKDAGRWGGAIWELARITPAPAGRSPALALLGGLGALVVALGCHAAVRGGRGRSILVLLCAAAAWLAAHSWSALAFQRYLEPMALLILIWLGVLCGSVPGPRPRGWWLGPAALAALQLGLCWFTLYGPVLRGPLL
jgi:hypothetical protein